MGSEYYRFGGASNENNKEKKNKGGGKPAQKILGEFVARQYFVRVLKKRFVKNANRFLRTRTKKYDSGNKKYMLLKCFVRVLKSRFVVASVVADYESKIKDPDKKIRFEKQQNERFQSVLSGSLTHDSW